jgi:hypothetical protein
MAHFAFRIVYVPKIQIRPQQTRSLTLFAPCRLVALSVDLPIEQNGPEAAGKFGMMNLRPRSDDLISGDNGRCRLPIREGLMNTPKRSVPLLGPLFQAVIAVNLGMALQRLNDGHRFYFTVVAIGMSVAGLAFLVIAETRRKLAATQSDQIGSSP